MRKLKLEELNRLELEAYRDTQKVPLVIVLDNIRSAQNTGAFFRSADCFAIQELMLCGITPTPPHKDISKSAIGSTHSVNWSYTANIVDAINKFREDGYQIIGIEQTTESLNFDSFTASKKTALIFGNEVDGLSADALPLLDHSLEIKQFGTKHSLNVAVCAGIVMHKISNQLRS